MYDIDMKKGIAEKLLQDVPDAYNTIAAHFSETRKGQWKAIADLVQEYVKPGMKVLDLGCGSGRVSELIDAAGGQYVGMDVSSGLIEQARQQYPEHEFHVGTMLETGFHDAEFDVLLLVASFHHVPSDELRLQTLQEMARILKPGGIAAMTNWNLHQRRYRALWRQSFIGRLTGSGMEHGDLLVPWKNPDGEIQADRYYHAFSDRELRKLIAVSPFTLLDQWYEERGELTNKAHGQNIVSVMQRCV